MLLSIIGAFAVLVVGLTLATPGRADRQLIERGMELVTLGACLECRAAHVVTGKPDEQPPRRLHVFPARLSAAA